VAAQGPGPAHGCYTGKRARTVLHLAHRLAARVAGRARLQFACGCALRLDLIALLFAEAGERVVRGGLLNGYVRQEIDLPVLRGHLLGDRQIRRRYGRIDRLECQYADHKDRRTSGARRVGREVASG
jgi:hypothetical protein